MFNHEEELTLIDHIRTWIWSQQLSTTVDSWGIGNRSSNKAHSNNWDYSFLNRWSDRIASLKQKSIKSNHAKSSSPEIIDKYHSNVRTALEKYELQDRPQNSLASLITSHIVG